MKSYPAPCNPTPTHAHENLDDESIDDDPSCDVHAYAYMELHRHRSYAARMAAGKVTIRFLVVIVVFVVAYSSLAHLLTAGNSTAAAVDLSRRAIVQAPASPPRRSGRSTHRPVVDGATPLCDVTTDPQHQICRLVGDVRAVGATNTVLLYVAPAAGPGQKQQANATTTWRVKAQSGRYIRDSERVNVEARVVPHGRRSAPPACTARCPSPAVVFTVSRHLRNLWHSFADVLVPLFATARAFDRRVQLLVTNGRRARWFAARFAPVLEALSAHDVIDFDADREVRCYPRAIVGLRGRGDLAVGDGNSTLLDFRAFLRSAYSLPPASGTRKKAAAKPRLMLVDRHKTRRFVNTPEISAAVRRAGFELVAVEPRPSGGGSASAAEELSAMARLADSCDVLVGAHGAGLTHLLFLRAGSVVVEVVPYGLAAAAAAGAASTYRDFFERPARALRLRYVSYEAAVEESTLLERYGAAHPVVSDPVGVYRRGEAEGKPYAFRHYWYEQDIRVNVTRFGAVLERARRHVVAQWRRA